MITDEKHEARLTNIPQAADDVHDSALGIFAALKRLSTNTGRNSQQNLLKFEKLIQGHKNG
jgi:hypothetical protein